MECGSRLSWKAAVAAAFVSFLLLHAMAGIDAGVATDPREFGSVLARQILRTIGSIGQYVVPFALAIGAIVGFLKQRQRTALIQSVARNGSTNVLDQMTWREFESLVEEAFRLKGYSVTRISGDGPDGGVDLELRRGSETTLVQCKQWRAFKVGVQVVRELYGVMAARAAASGIVVTSGAYTQDAIEFARGRNVQLIAGYELRELVREARNSQPASTVSSGLAQVRPAGEVDCPICGSIMVRRQAKRGANAGAYFFGCSRYPACKGTRAA